MDNTKSMALMIVGPPKSGLTALFTCLQKAGVEAVRGSGEAHFLAAEAIDRLLFQELNTLPTAIRGLPDRWITTGAASKAKKRINKLIAPFFLESDVGMIAGASLCRTLPVWLDACTELGIEPRFVIMTRHPWETARSMNSSSDEKLQKGLLLWLSCIREAMAVTHDFPRSFVTLDQVLADPVSTAVRLGNELDLGITQKIGAAYLDILNIVQPERRHYHAGNSPEEDRRIFAPFTQIYNGIRTDMGSVRIPDGIGRSAEGLRGQETLASSRRLPQAGAQNLDIPNSLIDILFETIGLYESEESAVNQEKRKLNQIAVSDGPLFSVIHIPADDTASRAEQVFLLPDEWQKIFIPLPSVERLRKRPIRMAPLNVKGMVQISVIQLVNRVNSEPVWAVNQAKNFHVFGIQGEAFRLSGSDSLSLVIAGNDAVLEFPPLAKLPDCPLSLEIWIKASSNQSAARDHFQRQVVEDASFAMGTIHHLSCTGGTVICKCLASMNDVVLLSEISPVRYEYGWFNPFDPLQHFLSHYPSLRYTDKKDFQRMFMDRLFWIVQKCRENNQFFIIRDHSHNDFLEASSTYTPVLHDFISPYYTIRSIVTIRNPIDSWLSLKFHDWFPHNVENFDAYCKRILRFLEQYPFANVFRYEDFVADPDSVLKKMCDVYQIAYNPDYRNVFHEKQLTGDSGRGKSFTEIKELERRSCDDAFWDEVLESPSFDQLAKQYDYTVKKKP